MWWLVAFGDGGVLCSKGVLVVMFWLYFGGGS
jgi:hypothetical protein